ncbi:hypothetical protein HCU01_01350 [Halomonas cupida]|uniref:Uncharacterized protein n=1 Tax=Halomonas cupida TaxID=44933 RepID=A0A1M7B0N9_9GAMM|nr:hypothetical protein [Halomonas cupida]GEN22186.1 hypothetical protein HCU01_01350 [Halomonas cupida]SHL48535.1 hypothetical protein SAMN05660971_00714 [Halomonas cupida]
MLPKPKSDHVEHTKQYISWFWVFYAIAVLVPVAFYLWNPFAMDLARKLQISGALAILLAPIAEYPASSGNYDSSQAHSIPFNSALD